MQIGLLVESTMRPIPDDIEVLEDYGSEAVVNKDGRTSRGDSVIVKGETEAIKNWLRPFDRIWLIKCAGVFEISHIKD